MEASPLAAIVRLVYPHSLQLRYCTNTLWMVALTGNSRKGGRQKAACCTVTKAPPRAATCSTNLCTLFPGFCPNDNDDQSANNWSKRELDDTPFGDTEPDPDADDIDGNFSVLEKRGNPTTSVVELTALGLLIRLRFAGYPSSGSLFRSRNGDQVLRQAFRLNQGRCSSPVITTSNLGPGPSPSGMTGQESEHPVDVSHAPAPDPACAISISTTLVAVSL